MMQAGVCLSQDTETTLPDLTEQQRTRQKEDKFWGLESVHMAGSETVCAAPGLDTLEPECVSAHSGVSDVHNALSSLIKTETHAGDIIKTEGLDSAELRCVSQLHSDQIKTESVDGGYFKAEHISELHDVNYVNFKSDQIKYESSKCLVNDVMDTVMIGAAVGHNESGQCAGEPNQNIRNEDIHHLLTQCGDLYHNCDSTHENTQHRIVLQKSTNRETHAGCQGTNMTTEPIAVNLSRNPSLSTFFHKKANLRNHRKINIIKKLYQCTQCEKCFSQKSALNCHQTVHTGEKPYRCTQCEKCFSQKSALSFHQRVHTGERPYKCPQCEKCFSKKSVLSCHERIHTGEKPYRCTQCDKWFSQISALRFHKRIHTGERPFKCTECGKGFARMFNLNRHQSMHAAPMLANSITNPDRLSFFQKKTIHRNKIEGNTGEKPYRCTQCEKCFSWEKDLNCHMRIHAGERPYICTECGKRFPRIFNLNRHMRIHTGEKPYICTECGKCFPRIFNLNRHKRVHTGEKPYRCTHCEMCFLCKRDLNSHMRIHTGGHYICAECGKCFSQRNSLSRHKSMHSGEKDYN